MALPPPKTFLGVLVAAAMTPSHDPRFSANWAAAREKDNERRAMTEARWNEEEAARQVASRKAYEGSLRRRTACPQGATFLRRCGEWKFRKRMAARARWASRR